MKIKLMNDWEKSTINDAIGEFFDEGWRYYNNEKEKEFSENILEDIEWIFGSYSYANYSGDAFILFKKGGKIFEVNGGHCSCSGLEDQWSPEETTIEAIKHRLDNGNLGSSNYEENEFKSGLIEFLNEVVV